MHHKRKRSTTRREGKRLDSKSYRMAEAQAIIHDERTPDSPRVSTYAYKTDPLPLGDLPCNGSRHGKKKVRPKKEKCSRNRTHEWYKETVETEDYYIHHTRCLQCLADGRKGWYGGYVYGCSIHGEKHYYMTRKRIATCIHCWKVKILDSERIYPDDNPRYTWRGRKRIKHRTQDPVSGMTVSVR